MLSLKYFDQVISVSRFTAEKFAAWSKIDPDRVHLLPNCVDLDRYGVGPKPAELARRLGIEGKTILMTVGRLSTLERYKGFDEIIEALPDVARKIPNIIYLVCGEGPDRERLQNKAEALGVGSRVLFAGFIPEEQKADYYRLADAYVMPSRGEGFGIVFLEAMACGIPVLGSRVDGSREALLDGKLGLIVDPSDRNELIAGILQTLARPRGVPAELKEFSSQKFKISASNIIRGVTGLKELA
jgi:glycosyltransferase involved in cell wall biosynthesis